MIEFRALSNVISQKEQSSIFKNYNFLNEIPSLMFSYHILILGIKIKMILT